MTGQDFHHLIEKYRQGNATDDEKALLDTWFDTIKEGDGDFYWQRADEDRQFAAIRGKIKARGAQVSLPVYTKRWFQLAATLLLLACCTYVVWHVAIRNDTVVVATANGQTEKVILSDGTIVWLKGSSTLQFPERFNAEDRTVLLAGEALFEVTKDPTAPFVIRCGALRATVLGTSFNIKASEQDMELMVLTGRVELSHAVSSNALVVLPNQKVTYDGSVTKPAEIDDVLEKAKAMEGTEYNMAFSNTTMAAVFRRIEQKFDTRVTVDNELLGNCLITADFTDQSLEDTLRMMAHILGFEYKITGTRIVITGGGCG